MRVASLNANGVFKDASSHTLSTRRHQQFTKYLQSKHLSLDLLLIQDLYNGPDHHLSPRHVHQFTRSFGTQSVFTKSAAIVALHPRLSILDSVISRDQRVIWALLHDSQTSTSYNVVNVYAPPHNHQKAPFWSEFTSLPFFSSIADTDEDAHWIVGGDFNAHLHATPLPTWTKRLAAWLKDAALMDTSQDHAPTFQRGNSTTTIDYLFVSPSIYRLSARLANEHVTFSDHRLVWMDLASPTTVTGPGMWRFNPFLLEDADFCDVTLASIAMLIERKWHDDASPDEIIAIWEHLKQLISSIARDMGPRIAGRRRREWQRMQATEKRLLADSPSHKPSPALLDHQKVMDAWISNDMERLITRSATRWAEKGEQSNAYFFKVIKQRNTSTTMRAVIRPDGSMASNTDEILSTAHDFYVSLYSPESRDKAASREILSAVPSSVKLKKGEKNDLLEPPSLELVSQMLSNSPRRKSPGPDGLPFELYIWLFETSPAALDLFTRLLANALDGAIPSTWQQTRMLLLYKKKGDIHDLRNWRPLSMINCDAKVFTRMLADRLRKPLARMLNPAQTGFVAGRHISSHGWVAQALMEQQCRYQNSPHQVRKGAWVMACLDQEKAYDRIHPDYMADALRRFGFPKKTIDTLQKLLFGTDVTLSINGFQAEPFRQARGLRQGDPLSQLLFNLTIEPLIRSIIKEPAIRGIAPFGASYASPSANARPTYRVKIMAYADDLAIMLQKPADWDVLMGIYDKYALASNARLNVHKTELISLSGNPHPAWWQVRHATGAQWHDKLSTNAAKYLGFPLYSTPAQLNTFLADLTRKVEIQ